ncbi:MAG: glycoside hydrolase family 3 C-terminal domain-containing protein [Tetragenococcus sp.]|nr:glycoside hydrolase family 3 C-terminal domain-containing protein [Tetragenococcus sp.]
MYTKEDKGQWTKINNQQGATLGISKDSQVELLEVDDFLFKDLNQNGKLDPYEDWRLPLEERIADLVNQLTIEQIAGLMLYSSHQAVSSSDDEFSKMFRGTYNGKTFEEYNGSIADLSDQQKAYLTEENIRHFLLTVVDSPEVSATWSNHLQAAAEVTDLGIPVNISSDPRHSTNADTEFNAGAGGDISKWPEQLGLAATFDPSVVKEFADIARQEYRALGITTALSPQIDLATEPRWMRFDGTFGEGVDLVTAMAQAYCDGFQTSGDANGWGSSSVNTMAKHWPGGGSGEAGRDAHFGYGKYAVYPGKNFEQHLQPFLNGALNLQDGTKKAAAIMPYYTISYQIDQQNDEDVGNGYSKYLVTDLLRETYQFGGVVCTDWGITEDAPHLDDFFSGKPWGVEDLTVAERHYKALLAGVDQFGGNNELAPVMQAFNQGVEDFGEAAFTKRFRASAKRLLRNIFQVGLFENPYVDVQAAEQLVGNADFMKKGYEAQQKSIVLLKNQAALPLQKGTKVYIPKNQLFEQQNWFGQIIPAEEVDPVQMVSVNKYFERVTTSEESETILCFITSPATPSYQTEERYLPISLQYGTYQATKARKEALAGESRSYYNKTTVASNVRMMKQINELKQKYPEKKLVVVMNLKNPTIVSEFEQSADAILAEFGVQNQAIFDVLSGEFKPQGRLPFQMPKDMTTVETQQEDVPLDMDVYVDSDGHAYDFGYGLEMR